MNNSTVYLNGRLVAGDKAKVSVFDRGLTYGDGLFETIKAVDGRPVFLSEHLKRLGGGAKALGFATNALAALMRDIEDGVIEKLLEKNGLATGVASVRITVTRGVSIGAHSIPEVTTPTTVMITREVDAGAMEKLKKRGVRAVLVRGLRPVIPGVKTINFLPNILGKAVAVKKRAYDGIFVAPDGALLEATSSNLFIVSGGVVKTPPLDTAGGEGVLPGVTREVVIDIARKDGIPAEVTPVFERDLEEAGEAFLTNSIVDIMPLVKVESVVIGSGRPGPVTARIAILLSRHLTSPGG